MLRVQCSKPRRCVLRKNQANMTLSVWLPDRMIRLSVIILVLLWITSNQDPSVSSSSSSFLYTVPEIFRHDLLNTFLTRFKDGDYRFVYWGPAGERRFTRMCCIPFRGPTTFVGGGGESGHFTFHRRGGQRQNNYGSSAGGGDGVCSLRMDARSGKRRRNAVHQPQLDHYSKPGPNLGVCLDRDGVSE